MLTRGPAGKARLAGAALIAAMAFGVSAGAAGAQQTTPLPEITPQNAAQLLPAGYEKVGNDYVYDGGNVIVTPASPDAVAGLPCNAPWLCLYEDSGWNGTRWQFQNHAWQDLNPYGASDRVSSWSNHESRNAALGWDSISQGIGSTLTLPAGAHASSMGGWNDEASSVLP